MSLVLRYFRDSRIFENVYHVSKLLGGVISGVDIDNAVDAAIAWWNATGKGLFPGSIQLADVTATKLDPADPIQLVVPVGVAGTLAQTILPANVTLAVGNRTGLAGRKFRGRTYIPGIGSSWINVLDDVTSVGLATIVTGLSALDAFLTGETPALTEVIFHRATNTHTNVQSHTADVALDSQRRRLPERGI
jgi:hypothetical protein